MRTMYERILLPMDGSELAENALAHAVAQAERFHAELVLLRVLVPLAERPGLSRPAVKKAEEMTRTLAQEYLQRVADKVKERGISVQVVIVEGRPHE
jgi:nucleotide-binding universal stress UspA family protein